MAAPELALTRIGRALEGLSRSDRRAVDRFFSALVSPPVRNVGDGDVHLTGDAIPSTCFIKDLCRILRVSRRTFERHHRGWGLIEMDRLDGQRRFTGESVERLRNRWAKKGQVV